MSNKLINLSFENIMFSCKYGLPISFEELNANITHDKEFRLSLYKKREHSSSIDIRPTIKDYCVVYANYAGLKLKSVDPIYGAATFEVKENLFRIFI